MVKWSKGPLCSYCEKKVTEKETLIHRRFYEGVPHYYLFDWCEESDHFCKRVVYFLKKKPEAYFHHWASYFRDEIENKGVSALLSPKSVTLKEYNHAASFSGALKKLFPYSSVIEVGVGGKSPQKRKTKKERFLEVENKSFGKELLDSNWIFVDDVFVTGATYEKVRKRMGSSPECIVTMFYRSLWEMEDDG